MFPALPPLLLEQLRANARVIRYAPAQTLPVDGRPPEGCVGVVLQGCVEVQAAECGKQAPLRRAQFFSASPIPWGSFPLSQLCVVRHAVSHARLGCEIFFPEKACWDRCIRQFMQDRQGPLGAFVGLLHPGSTAHRGVTCSTSAAVCAALALRFEEFRPGDTLCRRGAKQQHLVLVHRGICTQEVRCLGSSAL